MGIMFEPSLKSYDKIIEKLGFLFELKVCNCSDNKLRIITY